MADGHSAMVSKLVSSIFAPAKRPLKLKTRSTRRRMEELRGAMDAGEKQARSDEDLLSLLGNPFPLLGNVSLFNLGFF